MQNPLMNLLCNRGPSLSQLWDCLACALLFALLYGMISLLIFSDL